MPHASGTLHRFPTTPCSAIRLIGVLIGLMLLCMHGLYAGGIAHAEQDPIAANDAQYVASGYFDSGYSALAVIHRDGGGAAVTVSIQYAPNHMAEDTIVRYNLYVNDTLAANVEADGSDSSLPTLFMSDIASLAETVSARITPVYGTQGEVASEALLLAAPDASLPLAMIGQTATVHNPDPTDRLNLRVAPNGQADSLRQYYNGVPVRIWNVLADDWAAVTIGLTGGIAKGYMKTTFLQTEDGNAVSPMMPTQQSTVSSWSLFSLPDEASTPVATYGPDVAYEIWGRSSAWWHIRVGDQTGFVRADVITEVPEPSPEPSDAGGDTLVFHMVDPIDNTVDNTTEEN